MKKFFILALALAMCLSFYGCGGKEEDTDVEDLIVETQKVVDGGVRMVKGLDKKGRVLKETCYNDDGEVDIVIEYDKNGNKTKSYEYEDGIACVIVEYGKNGNAVAETWYDYDDGEIDIVIEYDTDGNKTKSYEYENGIVCGIVEYGKNGNAVAETWYDYDDGFLDEWKEVEYNEKGIAVKGVLHEGDGSYEEAIYDENRNEISYVKYNKYGDIIEKRVDVVTEIDNNTDTVTEIVTDEDGNY